MVSYVGQMEAFDPNEGECSTYVEHLEMFFVVNNVPEDKSEASLITLMGGKMYAPLKSLTTPTKPMEISFKEKLWNDKFDKYRHEESQSIREFLAELPKLAETFEFGGYQEENFRDRLGCGITSQIIRRKLLGEVDLTQSKKVVDIAVGMGLTVEGITQIFGDKKAFEVELHKRFRCGKQSYHPDKGFSISFQNAVPARKRVTQVQNAHGKALVNR